MRWQCRIVERALDLGVNYIDTSSIYGGLQSWSERYIAQEMRRRRRGFASLQLHAVADAAGRREGDGDRHPAGTLDMREAMYFTLSRPVSTVIIGRDSIQQLEQNVQLARDFTPLSGHRMRELTAKRRRNQGRAVSPIRQSRGVSAELSRLAWGRWNCRRGPPGRPRRCAE